MASTPTGYIFTRYITKNGRRIYKKDGGVFRIPITDERKRPPDPDLFDEPSDKR